MGFLKRRVKKEIDKRTELEKTFEEKGRNVGAKIGELVQKNVYRLDDLKEKYDADEKIEKIKDFTEEATQKGKEVIEKATQKGKEVVEKIKSK